MTNSTYNGWTNYETWNVKLWLDNEQGDYLYWQSSAQESYDNADCGKDEAILELSRQLKDQIEEANPLVDQSSMFADLLGAALCDVNWYEIATAMIDDHVENSVEI